MIWSRPPSSFNDSTRHAPRDRSSPQRLPDRRPGVQEGIPTCSCSRARLLLGGSPGCSRPASSARLTAATVSAARSASASRHRAAAPSPRSRNLSRRPVGARAHVSGAPADRPRDRPASRVCASRRGLYAEGSANRRRLRPQPRANLDSAEVPLITGH